jgi:hypothetical protein
MHYVPSLGSSVAMETVWQSSPFKEKDADAADTVIPPPPAATLPPFCILFESSGYSTIFTWFFSIIVSSMASSRYYCLIPFMLMGGREKANRLSYRHIILDHPEVLIVSTYGGIRRNHIHPRAREGESQSRVLIFSREDIYNTVPYSGL